MWHQKWLVASKFKKYSANFILYFSLNSNGQEEDFIRKLFLFMWYLFWIEDFKSYCLTNRELHFGQSAAKLKKSLAKLHLIKMNCKYLFKDVNSDQLDDPSLQIKLHSWRTIHFHCSELQGKLNKLLDIPQLSLWELRNCSRVHWMSLLNYLAMQIGPQWHNRPCTGSFFCCCCLI